MNIPLTTADFYLLRTPAFSTDRLATLNALLERQDIRAIKEIFSDEFFLKAIYFSSREFYRIAKIWLADDTISYNKADKILITLYKYYNRICTRSTPYGFFAGFAAGNSDSITSKITFRNEGHFEPIFRADLIFLNRLKKDILQENGNKKILYYPNNTMYKFGDKLRFIEWDNANNYEISETSGNWLLEQLLAKAKAGVTKADMCSVIGEAYADLEESDINGYIDTLIDNKIFVDQLPPYITGIQNPVFELHEQLIQNRVEATALKELDNFISTERERINVDAIENFSKPYEHYLGQGQHPFQVDLKLNLANNKLNHKVVDEILSNALEIMAVIKKQKRGRMITFKENFYRKFEDREIPLAQALDPQLGVGYDLHISGNVEEMPLLESLDFSYEDHNDGLEDLPLIRTILKKYLKHLDVLHQQHIVLTEDDIKAIPVTTAQYKWNHDYHLLGDLLTDDTETLDQGDFKFFCKSALPSPYMSNLFSRFAYHDEILTEKLKKYNEVDEDAGYIYAEIIHHPGGRIGNVLLRPKIFDYEIPYVTDTNPAYQRIELDDIMVSIRNNEVFLRSKALNKEIRPRLSSAHNFSKEQLPVFRFLCAMQYQNVNFGLEWDWSVLSDLSYLPRVEYKKLILAEARWKIGRDKNINLDTLQETVRRLGIPKNCKIKEGDNVILIDTENSFALSLLLRDLKTRDLIIYEHFEKSDFITHNGSRYSAEFLFPVINNLKSEGRKLQFHKEKIKKRIFYPGEEWTYVKVYCSHMIGDRIVSSVIKDTIAELNNTQQKDLVWFFIRYDDPDHHIRFRVKTTDVNGFLTVLNNHMQPLIEEKQVFSIQLDTYKREIERYGDDGIEQAELLFWQDSRAVVEFLNKVGDYEDEANVRWKTALASVDLLLDDFNLSLKRRKSLFEKAYLNFLPEFVDVSDKDFLKQFRYSIDLKLRSNRDYLDAALREKDYGDVSALMDGFHQRSKGNAALTAVIQEAFPNEERLDNLLSSYIHMSLNRIFYTKARMHELVIYYFMFKTYNSILSRDEKQHKH